MSHEVERLTSILDRLYRKRIRRVHNVNNFEMRKLDWLKLFFSVHNSLHY